MNCNCFQTHSLTGGILAVIVAFAVSNASQAQAPFLPAAKVSDSELNESIEPNFFQINTTGDRLVFLSTQNSKQELFGASVSEGTVSRINSDLVTGGNIAVDGAVARSVSPFQITNNGLFVVYVADQFTDGVIELFMSPITGGFSARLNADLPNGGGVAATSFETDFVVSSNGQHVVYVADQNQDDVFELFSVSIQGGVVGLPVRLNSEFTIPGSDVVEFQISFDSQQVVYRADQNGDETFELFSVPIVGGGAVRLNGNLPGAGDVDAFKISQDVTRVVYQADQNVFGDDELFSVPIGGGNPIRLNGDFAVSGAANSSDVIEFAISNNLNQVVFLADSITNDQFELFSVPILGGPVVRLSGDIVAGGDVRFDEFKLTNSGLNVVYVADQIVDGRFELFSASVMSGDASVLSPPGSNISSDMFVTDLPDTIFAISSNSEQVVFLTNFTGIAGSLYSVPTSGGTPVRLDAVAPGNIRDNFQISTNSADALFISQSTPGNLFRIAVEGGTAEQLNGELAASASVVNFDLSRNLNNDSPRVVYSANEADSSRIDLFSFGDLPAPATAVLPGSRSVLLGETATAFAAMINTTTERLENCFVGRPLGLPFNTNSFFQATDSNTNAVIGFANAPVDIPPGGLQTFVFGLIPNTAFDSTEIAIPFDCSNTLATTSIPGVNTLLLSGSETPVADIVALGATPSGDGILTLPGAAGSAAFAVASVNVGSSANLVASADTGDASLPLSLFICETNPADGQCLATPSATVVTSVASNATPTFSVFANASGTVPFDPANTRIRVRFSAAGKVRGSTSVAVRTQ